MRILSAEDAALVLQDVTTWAPCIRVSKRGGDVVRLTSHDRDLDVSLGSPDPLGIAGAYLSTPAITATQVAGTSDLAIDNLEVDALLDDSGLTEQEIRAGVFDDVEFVLFIVNWRDTAGSGLILKSGIVGNISDFLKQMAVMELRGLKQLLQQNIVDTVGPTCRYVLGDERCGVDLESFSYAGLVTGVSIVRRRIESLITGMGSPSPPEPVGEWFTRGLLTWGSGLNSGRIDEVKIDHGSGDVEFIEPLPYDITIGDTFTITPGCDHTHAVVDGDAVGDCGPKFDNIVNFGGEPFVPNQNSLVEAPD